MTITSRDDVAVLAVVWATTTTRGHDALRTSWFACGDLGTRPCGVSAVLLVFHSEVLLVTESVNAVRRILGERIKIPIWVRVCRLKKIYVLF